LERSGCGSDRQTGGLNDFGADKISRMRGVLHGHGVWIPFFLLMIVFQIHVKDFLFRGVDAERQTAIAGNAETPGSGSVARQKVRFPCRESVQFAGIEHVVQESQHFAKLIHRIGRNAFRAIFRVKLLQAFVGEAPYFHFGKCSL
jgi:hypothetical protein